jgi:hypothetical protein
MLVARDEESFMMLYARRRAIRRGSRRYSSFIRRLSGLLCGHRWAAFWTNSLLALREFRIPLRAADTVTCLRIRALVGGQERKQFLTMQLLLSSHVQLQL